MRSSATWIRQLLHTDDPGGLTISLLGPSAQSSRAAENGTRSGTQAVRELKRHELGNDPEAVGNAVELLLVVGGRLVSVAGSSGPSRGHR